MVEHYSLTIGKDSRDTLKAARAKAQQIESDITFERFDSTLARYGKHQPTVLEVVSSIQDLALYELWQRYVDNKLPSLKPITIEKYTQLSKLFKKLGSHLNYDSLAVKEILLNTTTVDRTRDCLMQLAACCNWGCKRKLIAHNPFEGMASEMPKPRYLVDPKPNAFAPQEREPVIAAFKNDSRPGMTYQHYAALVEFWFFTGCRPSEAIGLTWDKVKQDCTQVTFDSSIQTTSSGKKCDRMVPKTTNLELWQSVPEFRFCCDPFNLN